MNLELCNAKQFKAHYVNMINRNLNNQSVYDIMNKIELPIKVQSRAYIKSVTNTK